ncbi:MAG: type II secretion system protein [Bythopirellula sp.]
MFATKRTSKRQGMTLTELLSVVTLIGVLAVMVLPRVTNYHSDSKREACFANKGDIELQAQLWRRNNGSFPAANLSDVGADLNYFPSGVRTCPVDGTTYTIDTTTGRVNGHAH